MNPTFDVVNGDAAKADMEAKQTRSEQDAAAASRTDEIALQWAFHNFVLGAKTQVRAQFGDSSNEIQALGLKKKSEYKSPSKKKKTF